MNTIWCSRISFVGFSFCAVVVNGSGSLFRALTFMALDFNYAAMLF